LYFPSQGDKIKHGRFDCLHPWRMYRHPQRCQPNGAILLRPGSRWMVHIIAELFKKVKKTDMKTGKSLYPLSMLN
jgi:hypothetical protein